MADYTTPNSRHCYASLLTLKNHPCYEEDAGQQSVICRSVHSSNDSSAGWLLKSGTERNGTEWFRLLKYGTHGTEQSRNSHGTVRFGTLASMALIMACSLSITRGYFTMQGEPELVPVTTPRNMKQLRNLHHKQLQLSRISHDDMYNLHEIFLDISTRSSHFLT